MKSNQQRKNTRNNSQRRGVPVQFKQMESSGPNGKVKGTPKQIIEKYNSMANDYLSSGDRVTAETCLQFSEHYNRILIHAASKNNNNNNNNKNHAADNTKQDVSEKIIKLNAQKEELDETEINVDDEADNEKNTKTAEDKETKKKVATKKVTKKKPDSEDKKSEIKETEEAPVKKRRGRPKKVTVEEQTKE